MDPQSFQWLQDGLSGLIVGVIAFAVWLAEKLRNRNGHRKSLTSQDVADITDARITANEESRRAQQETTEFRAHVMRELAMLKDALGPERHAELVRAFEDVMSRELAPIRQDIRQLKRGDVA